MKHPINKHSAVGMLRFSCRSGAVALLLSVVTGGAIAADYTFNGPDQPWKTAVSDITNATYWSSGEMPSSGNNYIIEGTSSKYRYCGLGITTGSFPGDSLHVKQYGYLTLRPSSSTVKEYEFPQDGLILDGGNVYAASAWNKYVLKGTVTIGDNTVNNLYGSGGSNFGIEFKGAFTGGDSATLNVKRHNDETSNSGTFTVSFLADMGGYKGDIVVGGTTKNWARVLFGTSDTVHSVCVKPTGAVGPSSEGEGKGEFSVANLVLENGATLTLGVNQATNGLVRVMQKLTMPVEGKVNLNLAPYDSTSNFRYTGVYRPLLIAPLGTNLSEEQFTYALPSDFPALVKAMRCELQVEKTETSEILYWRLRPTYSAKRSDNTWKNESCFLPECASLWGLTDPTDLNPDCFYYVNGYGVATPHIDSGTAIFGGWALCITGDSKLYMWQSARIDRLYMNPGARLFYLATAMTRVLQGTVKLIDYDNNGDYAYFYGRDGRTFDIQSEITGNGGLSFSTHISELGAGSPTFQLDGTNSSFSGRIRVTNASAPTKLTTLKIADGRNLGGTMNTFTYNGIELRAGSRLESTDSVELAETTRGFYVYGMGRIRIPNALHEMKVRASLTMEGTLVKEGPGTLALGGETCLFTSEQSAVPIDGTNVLEVAGGRIKALSKNAFNGLAVKFAEGTGLEVPNPSYADEGVRDYGLCNVLWAAPFDLTQCGGKLAVSLENSSAIERYETVVVAVCTVSSSAAANLRGNIKVDRVAGHKTKITERQNDDGSITFLANIEPVGFIVFVK